MPYANKRENITEIDLQLFGSYGKLYYKSRNLGHGVWPPIIPENNVSGTYPRNSADGIAVRGSKRARANAASTASESTE